MSSCDNQQQQQQQQSSGEQQPQQQQEPDLMRAFFRTRPSILHTVLPRALLSAVEAGNGIVARQKQRNTDAPVGSSVTKPTTTTALPPRRIFDTALRRRGFEISPSVCRFDALFTDVASEPSKRVKITEAVIRRANKIVQDNAKLVRSTSSKGVMKRVMRTNNNSGIATSTPTLGRGMRDVHGEDANHNDEDADPFCDPSFVRARAPRGGGPAAKPPGKKKAAGTTTSAAAKKASPKRASPKKNPGGKKSIMNPSPPAKRAPRKVVSKAQRDTDGVLRARALRLQQNQPTPQQQQKEKQSAKTTATSPDAQRGKEAESSSAAAAETSEKTAKQEEQKNFDEQRAHQEALQQLMNSAPPPGMTPFEWRRVQKMKLNTERLSKLNLGV